MKQHNESGYIALISSLVIAALLVALTFAIGYTIFFARFNILEAEYKERSMALAEACVDMSFLRLINNPAYAGNEPAVPVGSDTCQILPTSFSGGQVTIKTKGIFQKSVSNLVVVASTANFSIISWTEVPNLP